MLTEQSDHQARVEAARQQHSDWYIGHQPPPDCPPHHIKRGLDPVVFRKAHLIGSAAKADVPVPPLLHGAVRLDRGDGSRRQLLDTT